MTTEATRPSPCPWQLLLVWIHNSPLISSRGDGEGPTTQLQRKHIAENSIPLTLSSVLIYRVIKPAGRKTNFRLLDLFNKSCDAEERVA